MICQYIEAKKEEFWGLAGLQGAHWRRSQDRPEHVTHAAKTRPLPCWWSGAGPAAVGTGVLPLSLDDPGGCPQPPRPEHRQVGIGSVNGLAQVQDIISSDPRATIHDGVSFLVELA